jgi:hypothetical protein
MIDRKYNQIWIIINVPQHIRQQSHEHSLHDNLGSGHSNPPDLNPNILHKMAKRKSKDPASADDLTPQLGPGVRL